jgi:Concanavalin A-like lectin/glucanases superfamily
LRPSGGGTIGGNTTWVTGTTASPVNAWTHVALTYDGAALRLYVNGTQVATGAASGAIQARVYNRALSATDIQAAMNTPLT